LHFFTEGGDRHISTIVLQVGKYIGYITDRLTVEVFETSKVKDDFFCSKLFDMVVDLGKCFIGVGFVELSAKNKYVDTGGHGYFFDLDSSLHRRKKQEYK
jgi:hypothetical protein